MDILKQSTARNLEVFLVDSTDHLTGKPGLTLTTTASKDGAAFASITPTVTDLGSGWYNLALTTTHTNTLGDMGFHVTGTGADPLDFKCVVEVERGGLLGSGAITAIWAAVVDSSGITTLLSRLTAAIAAKLQKHTTAVLAAVVAGGSTTTSVVLNASTGIEGGAPSSTTDFYAGCALIFTSGALAGQRTSVSGYNGSTKTLTVVPLTGAPSAADTAILV